VATGTRGRVDGDRDDDGTLGGVKKPKRTVEVVRQVCRSMWRTWHLGLVPRAVERCLTPQVLEVRRRCPAKRVCVTCGPGVNRDSCEESHP
jgi:hypothetical protein